MKTSPPTAALSRPGRRWAPVIALLALGAASCPANDAPSPPAYRPGKALSGTLRSWGTPAMAGLLGAWEQGFKKYHPDMRFEDFLKGDNSAFYGIQEWVAELAVMGRPMYPDQFYGTFRRSRLWPVEVSVATGSAEQAHKSCALRVYVHKDNPLSQMTLKQLDGVFGAQRNGGWQILKWHREVARGPEGNLLVWGQLGLTGEWADLPVHPYGPPQKGAGSITFFETKVFGGADRWAEDFREYAKPEEMMAVLAKDRSGIGFCSGGHEVPEVKALALSQKDGGPFVLPTRETVASRAYPLARPVYIYLTVDTPNGDPASPRVDPRIDEFLRYILSREGQETVARQGDYLPLTASMASVETAKLHP